MVLLTCARILTAGTSQTPSSSVGYELVLAIDHEEKRAHGFSAQSAAPQKVRGPNEIGVALDICRMPLSPKATASRNDCVPGKQSFPWTGDECVRRCQSIPTVNFHPAGVGFITCDTSGRAAHGNGRTFE